MCETINAWFDVILINCVDLLNVEKGEHEKWCRNKKNKIGKAKMKIIARIKSIKNTKIK